MRRLVRAVRSRDRRSRRHVVDRDAETVAGRLTSLIGHRDCDRVLRCAIGIQVVQGQVLHQRVAIDHGTSIAIVDAEAPSRCAIVLAIAKGDVAGKGTAFVERRVGPGLHAHGGAGRIDGQRLATGTGVCAVLVHQGHTDAVVGRRGVGVRDVASCTKRLRIAVSPVHHIACHGIGPGIGDRTQRQGVDRVLDHAVAAADGNRGHHVIHRDPMVLHRGTAITVVDRHTDRAQGRVHRPIFIVGKGVLHIARHCSQFGRRQVLQRAAVVPVDRVRQRVSRSGHIRAHDVQAVAGPFIGCSRTVNRQRGAGVVHIQ